MSTVLNAAASYTGEAVLYGTLGLTYTDSTLNAAHTYSVQWVARKTRTAQAGNNTATVANGVLTGTLSFATTQGVRLFDSGGRNPLEGTLYILDLTNAKTYLTEPLSIRWQPLPAGLTVTSVTTSQTFQSLADTPATYSGQAAKAAVVNAAEDGLTFTAVAVPGTTTPLALGAASAGSAATVSRVDHAHPTTGMATTTNLTDHTGNTSNPHSVTAAQAGAPTTANLTDHTGAANPHSGSEPTGTAVLESLGTTAGDRIRFSASGTPARQACLVALSEAGAGGWAPALTAGADHTVTRTGVLTGITPSGLEIGEGCSGTITGAYETTTTGVTADWSDALDDIAAASVGFVLWREAGGYRMICWEKA